MQCNVCKDKRIKSRSSRPHFCCKSAFHSVESISHKIFRVWQLNWHENFAILKFTRRNSLLWWKPTRCQFKHIRAQSKIVSHWCSLSSTVFSCPSSSIPTSVSHSFIHWFTMFNSYQTIPNLHDLPIWLTFLTSTTPTTPTTPTTTPTPSRGHDSDHTWYDMA